VTTARVVITHLELAGPAALRPAPPPRIDDVALAPLRPPDGAVNRWFYATVGAPHQWTDHLGRDDQWWHEHARRCETWVATAGGRRAGYFELGRPDDTGSVELQYFGLLPAFQGAGLGGHMLSVALARGLELAGRVWVRTCTLDGPHALANYEARGMRPYRREVA
jgi:GNAT superfamily N-acetyltransferase